MPDRLARIMVGQSSCVQDRRGEVSLRKAVGVSYCWVRLGVVRLVVAGKVG